SPRSPSMPGRWARPFPHGSLIPLREDVDLLVLDRLATMRASLVFRRQLAAAIGAHELGTRFRESPRIGTFGCGDIRDNAHEIMNCTTQPKKRHSDAQPHDNPARPLRDASAPGGLDCILHGGARFVD